jgi:hypothetical protein
MPNYRHAGPLTEYEREEIFSRVDPDSAALIRELPRSRQGQDAALRWFAERWERSRSTAPDCDVTDQERDALTQSERQVLERFFQMAVDVKKRDTAPLLRKRRGGPLAAWEIEEAGHKLPAASLDLALKVVDHRAVRKAAVLRWLTRRVDAGCTAGPDCEVTREDRDRLTLSERRSLKRFFQLAVEAGQRASLPVLDKPQGLPPMFESFDLAGIDPAAVDLLEHPKLRGLRAEHWAIVHYLGWRRDNRLATDLDCEINNAEIIKILTDLHAGRIVAPHRRGRVQRYRWALGNFYRLAVREGLRRRAVPTALVSFKTPKIREELDQLLGPAEVAKLRKLEGHLRLSAQQQQLTGHSGRRLEHRRKSLTSQSTGDGTISKLYAFFDYARRKEQWRPFTLDALLTPERIVEYIFRAANTNGTVPLGTAAASRWVPLSKAVRTLSELDLLEFGDERFEELRKRYRNYKGPQVIREHDTRKVSVAIREIEVAERVAHEILDEARLRGSIDQLWKVAQRTTQYITVRGCLGRADTIATMNLLHLRTCPETGTIRWPDGSVEFAEVRAKQTGESYTIVQRIPGEVVDWWDDLLALEERTLEAPGGTVWLQPAVLDEDGLIVEEGDHHGADQLLGDPVEVAPLWRRTRLKPDPLTYSGVISNVETFLEADCHWRGPNIHAGRAAGTIRYKYLLGASDEYIMALGGWKDLDTMRSHYAHLIHEDAFAEGQYVAPSRRLARSSTALDLRVKAIERIAERSVQLKGTVLSERGWRLFVDDLSRVVENALAASDSNFTPDAQLVKLTMQEVLLINDRLPKGGLEKLLKRAVLPTQVAAKQRRALIDPNERPVLVQQVIQASAGALRTPRARKVA